RRTEPEVSHWLNNGEGLIVRVKDRFGDYGLVGAMLYQAVGPSLVVDTMLLSCRVLGRGVEHRMLKRLAEITRVKGCDWVDLHFVPTARNKPALDFLERVGGQHKQPLNGGFVFRLPAKHAAELSFQAVSEPQDGASKQLGVSQGSQLQSGPGPWGGFTD